MKSLRIALSLLTINERWSAIKLLPLIVLRGVAEMASVGLIFPFLKILSEPSVIETNSYLAYFNRLGGFESLEDFVFAVGAVFVGVLLLATILKVATIYVVNRWLELRKHSLSTRLLETYLRQPYEFALVRHSGELLSTMLAESARIVGDVLRSITDVVQSLVSVIFMLGLLFYVDAQITILTLGIFGCLYTVLLLIVRRQTRRLSRTLFEENKARYRFATEGLRGAKLARLYNREKSLVDSFVPHSQRYAITLAAASLVKQVPRVVIELFAIAGVILLSLVMMVRNGGIGSESMASVLPLIGVFALAIYRMMPAFQKGYTAIIAVRLSHDAASAIRKDLSASNKLPPLPTGKIEPLKFEKSIEFRRVSYFYPGATEPGLKDINLVIEANTSIGIVGQTGAGKTTLMDLILGLIEPTEGEILIDGAPLRPDQFRSWRACVGYVPQETFLSDASIAKNIAFGIPDTEIDQSRVAEAAKLAQLDTFVESLPAGYETLTGEEGVRLSGGQRQRIGIARALFSRPRVIAFDEATSALDTETETNLIDAISGLVGTKTLIMVTHRLSTVRGCDMVITLNGGEISALGSYEEIALPSQAIADEG